MNLPLFLHSFQDKFGENHPFDSRTHSKVQENWEDLHVTTNLSRCRSSPQQGKPGCQCLLPQKESCYWEERPLKSPSSARILPYHWRCPAIGYPKIECHHLHSYTDTSLFSIAISSISTVSIHWSMAIPDCCSRRNLPPCLTEARAGL